MRVIVPSLCQTKVLEELYTSHPRNVKMKSLACLHVWWTSIDQHIEKMVQNCRSCQSETTNQPLHPYTHDPGLTDFMKSNGIKHIHTAPYHPSSNSEAGCFVQTFKHALKAGKNDKGMLHQKLTRFLLFLKHQWWTRLDLLGPSLEKRVATKQAKQKS